MLSVDELDSRFDHHPSTSESISEAHEKIRELFKNAAEVIDDLIIDGREKSLALTKIEEAMFWSNASVARSQAINTDDE